MRAKRPTIFCITSARVRVSNPHPCRSRIAPCESCRRPSAPIPRPRPVRLRPPVARLYGARVGLYTGPRASVRRRLGGAAGPFRTETLAYGASRRRTMRLAVLRSCGAVKSRRAAPPHRRAEMRSRFARFGHLFDLNLGQRQNKPHFSFRKKSKQYVSRGAPGGVAAASASPRARRTRASRRAQYRRPPATGPLHKVFFTERPPESSL